MPRVKKKTAKRGKSKKKAPGVMDRLRSFWLRVSRGAIAAFVLIAIVAGALFWSGGYFGVVGERVTSLANAGAVAAGFEVRRITVKGMEKVTESELLGAVGPVMGSSLLDFDPYTARGRVEDIGWVRSAAVTRLMPDTIHVSVREREPSAVWQMSGKLHLIDSQGAVIQEIGAYEYANLPLIVGAGAPGSAIGILKVLRSEPDLWGRVGALTRVSDRRWNMRTKAGYDIKFPEHRYAEAAEFIAQLHESTGILDAELEYIDLRNPENFVYRLKDAGESPIDDLDISGVSQ